MSTAMPTILRIGKKDALELLANRNHQRNPSKRAIARYAKDMLAGRWHLSAGNPLAIWEDTDGQWGNKGELYVLNGMHRLLAVIEADVELEFWVVYETDPNVFMTYDTGLVRTVGTLLQLSNQDRGVDTGNESAVASLVALVLRYERAPGILWQPDTVTKSEITEWTITQDWAELTAAVRDYHTLRKVLGDRGLGMWYGALRHLVRMHSTESAKWYEFHEALVHGTNLSSGDARLGLRNFLLRGQKAKTSQWQRQTDLAIGIKAWNAFIENKDRSLFVFRRDELAKSGMPKIL